jgi:hypothetical protein
VFARPPVRVVTLRDPVERIVSLYSLVVFRPTTNPPILSAMGRDTSLEAFLRAVSEVSPKFSSPNAQCRHFAPSGTFEAAREAFHRYSFIATPEGLDELVSAMSRAAGLRDSVRLGPVVNDAPRLPASSAALRTIEESTGEDRLLYEYVRQHGGLVRPARSP